MKPYLPPNTQRRVAALEKQSDRVVAGVSFPFLLDGNNTPILPAGTRIPPGGLVAPDPKPPDATSLVLTPGAGDGDVWLDASWTPASVGVAGPVVSWLITALEDGETLPLAPWTPLVSQAPPWRLSGLKPDTGYTVVVHAVTATGASSVGLSGHQDTGHDSGPPATLTGLAGAAYYTGLVVSWTHLGTVQLPFQGHYEAQIATNSGFTTGVQTDNTGLSSVASFAGLTTGTTYWVRVRAVSPAGVAGSWSTAITLTPGTVAPGDLAAGTLAAGVVYAGSIDAGQITTGTLDAAVVNVIHLNASNITAGSMSVGRLSAGTIGAILIQLASGGIIQSANYVAGVSGWEIDGAGNAELNNATFRGVVAAMTLAADDLTIFGQSGRKAARLFTEVVSGNQKAWLQLGLGASSGLGLYWESIVNQYVFALAPAGGGSTIGGLVFDGAPVQSLGQFMADGSITVGGSAYSGGVYPRSFSSTMDTAWGFEIANAGAGFGYVYSKAPLDGTGDHRVGWNDPDSLGDWLAFANTNGDLNARTSWFIFSSRTIKRNIQAVEEGTVRERLAQLVPSTYYLRGDTHREHPRVGFIGEDVQPLFPELVQVNGSADLPAVSLDYVGFIPYLVQDANETAARLDAIEARLSALT